MNSILFGGASDVPPVRAPDNDGDSASVSVEASDESAGVGGTAAPLASTTVPKIVVIVNVELDENMGFACTLSILPSGAQRPTRVAGCGVGSLQISSGTPFGEPCAAAPTGRS